MGNRQSDSNGNQGPRRKLPTENPHNTSNQGKRNLLPKEKLRQKRLQEQNKPIIEFPDDFTETKQDSADLKRTSLSGEVPQCSRNEQNHQRRPPMPHTYGNVGNETNHLIRNDGHFQVRHSYHEDQTGQTRYARHHWWADTKDTTKGRPTYHISDSTKFGHKNSKPNSQNTILKRGDDERFSRQKPTEKPKGYVLVRRDGNSGVGLNEPHGKMSKTNVNNSEIENQRSQNIKPKTPSVAKSKENREPNIDSYPQKKDSKDNQTIKVVNSEKSDRGPKTNTREHIQNQEELNQWMEGSGF